MSGLAILNSWLKENDPLKKVEKLFEIYNNYNKSSNKIFDKIRHWWIEHVTYPLFRYKVVKAQIKTAFLLYDHPNFVVFVLTRILITLQFYSSKFPNLTIDDIIDNIFPNDMINLKINSIRIQGGTQVSNYTISVKSLIPDQDDPNYDKFAITTLEVDIHTRTYVISQTVYDTNDMNNYSMTNIIHSKEYRLDTDGKLVNPNYILDHNILEEDLKYYRLMISQLLIFLGGVFDILTTLYFADIPSSTKK